MKDRDKKLTTSRKAANDLDLPKQAKNANLESLCLLTFLF